MIARLIGLFLAILLTERAEALEKVSLQLKWLHQFQFAGYYVALEKGFYREAGLEVDIREGGPAIDAMLDVASGKSDFGVCSTGVLLQQTGQVKVVVLGVIFQHSAASILVPSRSRINSLPELAGRRLMDASGSDDLAAMLKQQGVDYATLPRIEHTGNALDLVAGKADAMVSYVTNEPFSLEQNGIPYRSFTPRTFGFDFYGDNLCATEERSKRDPVLTRAFLSASLRGWEYALAHKSEAVDIITRNYRVIKSRDALMFEAVRTEALIMPGLIRLGSQTPERWNSIARIYQDLDMLPQGQLPDPPLYDAPEVKLYRWIKLICIAIAVLLLVVAAAVVLYRNASRTIGSKPRLSVVMSALFICLSIPILIFILAYNHQKNAEIIIAMLQEQIGKSRSATIETIDNLMRGVNGVLGLLAESAGAHPEFFRTEDSRDALYRVVTSSNQIDAAYVSFEDGYHRVVTRIDNDRKKSDPKIPATANWHSSFIDDFSAGASRQRHRTFFDTWPNVVGQYESPSTLDIRVLPGYAAARESRSLYVTEPSINPDTGYPIISARHPIYRNDVFIGCASANITFDVLSRFLAMQRPSRNSVTIIADPNDGKIVASSERDQVVNMAGGSLRIATLADITNTDVREAYRLHVETNRDDFVFNSPRDGRELSASFARFPESFGSPWQSVIITPTDDFVGQIRATNRKIILTIIGLTAIELLLIFGLARRLTRPIENVTEELAAIEDLSFEKSGNSPSKIREIAQLQTAAALLRSSLQSFSSFAPVEVVRGLVRSGIPLSLGVEKRNLTIFFSDIEGFSSHAEHSDPDRLLEQMSAYFEIVSRSVSEEKGTVDKFIGDGVMAFWGAPAELHDHALNACRGALRSIRRIDAANDIWRAEGIPTFRIRIGLNTANVLVGNVGSADRFSYTAMGDGVNVAARLEQLNKQFGTKICLSDSVLRAVKDKIVARPIRSITVRGREQRFMIYELLGISGERDPELMPATDAVHLSEMTCLASERFERGDFNSAAEAYREILTEYPEDPIAKAMVKVLQLSTAA